MFCPDCGSEYVAGVDICADCGSMLVAEPPAPPEIVEFEPIVSTPSPGEIAVIKSILEGAGIEFRIFSEIAGPPLSLPATILVPKGLAGEAKEILERLIEAGQDPQERRVHGWTNAAARPGRPSAAEVRTTGSGEATDGRERRVHGWTNAAARPGRPSAAEVRMTGSGEATDGRERPGAGCEEGADAGDGDGEEVGRGPADPPPPPRGVRAVVLDFGGVIAEEGFRLGLEAIALRNGVDPAGLQREAEDAIYDTGYLTGRGTESAFWERLRLRTGIAGTDDALAGEILERFVPRPRMIAAVRALRRQGVVVAILSDQTDWLERLDARYWFSREFDRVFNSYRLGKGKRDATIFDDVVRDLGVLPAETLFVDDNPGHVDRARSRGLAAVLFRGEDAFLSGLASWTAS